MAVVTKYNRLSKIKTIGCVVAIVFPMPEASFMFVNYGMMGFIFPTLLYSECTLPPAVDVGGCISNNVS